MPNPNYPVLTREQKRRKQAIRNWKRAHKQLIEYCYKAQECFKISKPYEEEEIPLNSNKYICDFLLQNDDKYWDDLYANKLIAENVAEFCLA